MLLSAAGSLPTPLASQSQFSAVGEKGEKDKRKGKGTKQTKADGERQTEEEEGWKEGAREQRRRIVAGAHPCAHASSPLRVQMDGERLAVRRSSGGWHSAPHAGRGRRRAHSEASVYRHAASADNSRNPCAQSLTPSRCVLLAHPGPLRRRALALCPPAAPSRPSSSNRRSCWREPSFVFFCPPTGVHTDLIMVVAMRLMRMGTTHNPVYRISVGDSRKAPTAKFIEHIGTYNPRPDKMGHKQVS